MENETTPSRPPRQRTCASCRFWDVRIRRTTELENSVARCLMPVFDPLHLVVSGSSGCDRWTPIEDSAPTE